MLIAISLAGVSFSVSITRLAGRRLWAPDQQQYVDARHSCVGVKRTTRHFRQFSSKDVTGWGAVRCNHHTQLPSNRNAPPLIA
jgi:hypothetical protein